MNHRLVFTLFLMFSFSFSSCQNLSDHSVRVYNDLAYLDTDLIKNDSLQRLNLAVPAKKKDCPLLIWVGGGAWSYVNRHVEMDFAQQFAKNGIAVASVGHRLSSALWRDSTFNGGAQHPDHIEDLAAAFKWLYDHADKYAYDRDKIFVGGFSSGAHLAALLSLDDRYLKKHGLSLENIKGTIPVSGAYDIINYHEVFKNGSSPELAVSHVESVFGNTEAKFKDASPTSYLENLSVPLLIIADNYIHRYTHFFEDALLETNFNDFEILYVYELNHGDLWRNLAAEKSRYRDLMINFMEEHSMEKK